MGPYQGTRSPAFIGSTVFGFSKSRWTTSLRPTMGPYQGTRSPAFTGTTNTRVWTSDTQLPIGKNDIVMRSDSSLKSIIRNGLNDGVLTLREGLKRTNTRLRNQANSGLRSSVTSLWTGLKNGVKNGLQLGTRTLKRAFTPRVTIRRPLISGNVVGDQEVQFTEQLDTTPLLLLRYCALMKLIKLGRYKKNFLKNLIRYNFFTAFRCCSPAWGPSWASSQHR